MPKLEIILGEKLPQSEASLARFPDSAERIKLTMEIYKIRCFACFGKISRQAKWCSWCCFPVKDLLH